MQNSCNLHCLFLYVDNVILLAPSVCLCTAVTSGYFASELEFLENGYKRETRRPASADRIARLQFQATGQPVSRTQASDGRSVCLSVCHTSEPCKNGCTDRAAFWVEDLGGPGEPY